LALQLLDAVDAAGTIAGDAVTVAALATAESREWGLLYLLRATEKGMRPWTLVMVLDVFLVLETRLQLGASGFELDGIGWDWLYSSNKMASVTGGT
jgi:hypothetical protein